MDNGAVAFVERVEFKVDGEFMRMRTFSGRQSHDHAIPMPYFIAQGPLIRGLIAEWQVAHLPKGNVVPLAKKAPRK